MGPLAFAYCAYTQNLQARQLADGLHEARVANFIAVTLFRIPKVQRSQLRHAVQQERQLV
jgi:hypothetical protein